MLVTNGVQGLSGTFCKILFNFCAFSSVPGDGSSYDLLERWCCSKYSGLCSRIVDQPARVAHYRSPSA